ncbi:MAG: hypothetical protein ACUVSF_04935 [Anaerolineae bacterium]
MGASLTCAPLMAWQTPPPRVGGVTDAPALLVADVLPIDLDEVTGRQHLPRLQGGMDTLSPPMSR